MIESLKKADLCSIERCSNTVMNQTTVTEWGLDTPRPYLPSFRDVVFLLP